MAQAICLVLRGCGLPDWSIVGLMDVLSLLCFALVCVALLSKLCFPCILCVAFFDLRPLRRYVFFALPSMLCFVAPSVQNAEKGDFLDVYASMADRPCPWRVEIRKQ